MTPKTGQTVAAVLTLTRLPIGALVAYHLYHGNFSVGFALYTLGLITDVLDGGVARKTGGTSDAGAELDRRADIVFNLLAVTGFCAGAYLIWGNLWWAVAPFIATGGLVVVTRPFFQPHSAASKIRSGVIRLLLLAFVCAKLSWSAFDDVIFFTLIAFGIPAIMHEWDVTKKEVRSGKRRWFKRPLAPITA